MDEDLENKKKQKRKILLVIGIFLTITLFVKLWQNYHWDTAVVELKNKNLTVLVADTYARQYRGLGGRKSLKNYDGMLFLHGTSDKYGMVMRDMDFPIDIVWLDKGQVVDIAPNVPVENGTKEANLMVYKPRKPANAVLELKAGWTMENSLKIGDFLKVISE